MGSLSTKFYDNCDSDIKTNLIEENKYILHTYSVSVKYSDIDYIKQYNKYNLHLCENDIILEKYNQKHIFIYQNIDSWFHSYNVFGFIYNDSKNNINNYQKIILYVTNSTEIINNLNNITNDLVVYYKTLS